MQHGGGLGAHYELSGTSGSDLLDLDAHDGDLIDGPLQGFQVSPQQAMAAPGVEAAGMQAAAPDPPKICVVVRKRPINRKVCRVC